MSTTTTVTQLEQNPLGCTVPPFTAHAISVSLPTWGDVVGYEKGEKRVVDAMVSGYPRFFIHLSIKKLADICAQKFGVNDEQCLLCPTRRIAEQCRAFMIDRSEKAGTPVPVRLVQFLICPEDALDSVSSSVELHIALFPENAFPFAKQFWQHTGLGISSRLAERCLSILEQESASSAPPPPTLARPSTQGRNRHYSAKGKPMSPPTSPKWAEAQTNAQSEILSAEYLEERYGRNLPRESMAAAKRALRRRIAGVLVCDTPNCWASAGKQDLELQPSTRGVEDVTENDVFLYPTGMSAIWSAHQLALAVRPPAKSICFGFPYTDTLKILEKWGPGCHFYGHGLDADILEIEAMLERESQKGAGPPILALFTEFPSNPLLRCANLPRLRLLADKYDFLLVVDETIGNFINVEVLPYADIVVSSLSKVFSGDANVMGGSLVLNPKGRHYAALKSHFAHSFEDSYFGEDAIYMERNSRDFQPRIAAIDANTEAICDFLRARSLAGGASSPHTVIKDVFYPKWETREHYDRCRLRGRGFGGLFSLTFTSMAASRAFFDTLPCQKGPSLGTNFTLASPYTILAHFAELDWAAEYNVEGGLVRVSVGLEERAELLAGFAKALEAAEAAVDDEA